MVKEQDEAERQPRGNAGRVGKVGSCDRAWE